jgi:glycolate oxidase
MTTDTTIQIVSKFDKILGTKNVLADLADRIVYECDGFTIEKNCPDIVLFPQTTDQVSAVVKICREYEVPFLPRGAGTSLAGGCLPVGGGVMIVLTKMNKIQEINLRDRYAIVEPGLVNLRLTEALAGSGFHYAPDPSSQGACTIGGNVATNSGGPHTLKYGVTVNHVLAAEIVTADGEICILGSPCADAPGLDLTGVLVGSEGTFAICTKAWVRLTKNPQGCRTMLAVFDSTEETSQAISGIIGAGIVPAALEMMDQGIIVALEEAFQFGFPLDAEAVLLIEVDGLEAGLDEQRDRVSAICIEHGAREVRLAKNDAERAKLWKCRKQAFGAIGRLSPSYCTQDGVVPRTKLPDILKTIDQISKEYDVRVVNVFHAGDGNLHPILLFDERDPDQVKAVLAASGKILDCCIEMGGSVTGEHGIGVEKISFMNKLYTESDIEVMERLRTAFNPDNVLSPGKMLPTAGACGIEAKHPVRRAAM